MEANAMLHLLSHCKGTKYKSCLRSAFGYSAVFRMCGSFQMAFWLTLKPLMAVSSKWASGGGV
jgi:hypothetical protein